MKKGGNIPVIPDFLQHLKKLGGTTDKTGRLNLPAKLGTGYIRRIAVSPRLRIMLQQFELKERMIIKRKEKPGNEDTLVFSFRNVIAHKPGVALQPDSRMLSSIQVSTFDQGVDLDIPAHVMIHNIIIGIEIGLLQELLSAGHTHQHIVQLLNRQQPFLYEELIAPGLQAIATAVFQADTADPLAHYFYRVKAEEMIYCFLTALLKRDVLSDYQLNYEDMNRVYAVRNALFTDLSIPPQLNALAKTAHMSVSKLGRLFRQMFGDSIYNYYQKIRMQHAAALLREKGHTVSEVGYQLGFSNLSHFTRLFEKHTGMKPKQYSREA
ncbi:helix-turn-helix transcriptional regulator [Taibaiella chishuiensis]|uniref:AraC-like DNA-binding protein n=1 Tax=Taibaiella chishuiensis TaxID=1434707 RepID=A0A2P8D7X7_9BACT|nr:AraC family transcriptional regulator [Taibaiella chishuiensis]PSK93313.1 AraC-like DNA-binding protein [Taibaiella chishuiensis]